MSTLFSDGLPIRLIETPRTDFRTCLTSERVGDVLGRNIESFDFFPVTKDDDPAAQIIGLFDAAGYVSGEADELVIADVMQPITEGVLIGADAPIISFVREADKRACRLVVSGPRISGLVTLFDLQRLPVRAALFAVVTQLEMTMTEWIRRAFAGSDEWLKKLSTERQARIHELIRAARKIDTYVDSLLFSQFADKRIVIQKCHSGLTSKDEFRRELENAEQLRNHFAHANDYATTKEAAKTVCVTVRSVEKWIRILDGRSTSGHILGA